MGDAGGDLPEGSQLVGLDQFRLQNLQPAFGPLALMDFSGQLYVGVREFFRPRPHRLLQGLTVGRRLRRAHLCAAPASSDPDPKDRDQPTGQSSDPARRRGGLLGRRDRREQVERPA